MVDSLRREEETGREEEPRFAVEFGLVTPENFPATAAFYVDCGTILESRRVQLAPGQKEGGSAQEDCVVGSIWQWVR